MEGLKTFIIATASIISSLGVIAGAIVACRKKLADAAAKFIHDIMDNSINIKLQDLDSKISDMEQSINDKIATMQDSLTETKRTVDDNEKNRLHSELMTVAARVRNGKTLHEDEYQHICEVYQRYTSLGGNGTGKAAFEMITHIYERQCMSNFKED